MAHTYQSNIPALANVANPNAANDLLYAKAPGVVLGQNIIPGNFAAAMEEAMTVQRYQFRRPNIVTTDEVGLAFERAHAIGYEHVVGIHPQAVVPAAFNNALNAAVIQIQATQTATQRSIAAIADNQAATQRSIAATQRSIAANQAATRRSIAATRRSIAATQRSIAANQTATRRSIAATQRSIAANQAATQAAIADLRLDISIKFENQVIKRCNGNARTQDYFLLLPLKKQVAGRGLGLPGQIVRLRRADLVALGAPMNLPPYPATLAHLNRLTLRELSRLSALFNEDFGIIPGDTVEIQRKKFQKFIG